MYIDNFIIDDYFSIINSSSACNKIVSYIWPLRSITAIDNIIRERKGEFSLMIVSSVRCRSFIIIGDKILSLVKGIKTAVAGGRLVSRFRDAGMFLAVNRGDANRLKTAIEMTSNIVIG